METSSIPPQIAGQPVLKLELAPKEGCVLLELGSTSELNPLTVKFYLNSTSIQVSQDQWLDAPASIHLEHFKVNLDEELELESYEIKGKIAPNMDVWLKVSVDGSFEVRGNAFKGGEMNLSVSVGEDGMISKAGLWNGSSYDEIELGSEEDVLADASRISEMLDEAADEFFSQDFAGFAGMLRSEPEIIKLIKKLGKPASNKDVM